MTPHGLDDAIDGNVGVMRGIDNGELSAKEGDGSLDCSRRCDLRKLKNPPSTVVCSLVSLFTGPEMKLWVQRRVEGKVEPAYESRTRFERLYFVLPGGGEVGVAILHGLDARHPSSIKRKKTKSQLVGRWLVIG
ncbi:hypothetical protein M0657_003270 [Pyricularia oryzae]|uniref:Uncharacterized protein n=1 Tax=Pyricularia oryzae TaxID=318829 RepID=A0A4P7MWE5_PYROR|nr:hypothetical protein M9X92_005348 [Pyricularia oryzae]KAI7927448.1 hypothetical protein M0657_003270 [Pyricularia oryzae]QBZ54429.1 hypothetical protein PoMZ_10129 [Pyricularia oryzae]